METWEAHSMQLEHKRGAWKITKGDSMIQKHALLLVGVLSTKMHAGLSNYYLWLLVHQYQNSNLQHMLKDWSSKNAFRRRQKKNNSRENYNPRQHGKIRHRQHTDASWSNRLVPLSADFLHRSSDILFQTLITTQVSFLIQNWKTTLNRDTTVLMNLSDQAWSLLIILSWFDIIHNVAMHFFFSSKQW